MGAYCVGKVQNMQLGSIMIMGAYCVGNLIKTRSTLTMSACSLIGFVSLSLSHWYPGSGVVLDCIDS